MCSSDLIEDFGTVQAQPQMQQAIQQAGAGQLPMPAQQDVNAAV